MADGYISAVQLPGDNTYDIKDKNAVTEIQINGTAQTKTNGVVNLPAYPTNTDEKVKQIDSTTNAAYRILFSNSANDDTETDQVKKSSNFLFNPSTGSLTLTGVQSIKSTNIDRDSGTTPASQVPGDGYYNLTDKDGEVVGRIRAYQNTDGGTTVGLYAYTEVTGSTSATSNSIQIARNKDGTNSYKIASPTAFRTAIEAIGGSGNSGYLAKFDDTRSLTNGPQLGSSTTTYLRNDGSWATPTDTTYSLTRDSSSIKLTPSSGSAQSITISSLLNALTEATANASDEGFYICSGQTESTLSNFYKRSNLKMWNYIKGKADAIYSTTDEKVKQSTNSEDKNFPLLFSKAETSNTTADITDSVYRNNNIYINPSTKQIFVDNNAGSQWKKGRETASLIKTITPTSYSPITDIKSTSGDWSIGTVNNTENLYFVYTTDDNYSGSGNKALKYYLEGADSTNSYAILHSGNYNSYSPTLTGTGASGDWGINAATATKATQDSDGNTIKTTYLKLSGGTVTGTINIKSSNLDITDTTINTTGKSIYFYDKNDVQIGYIKMLERTGGTIDTQIIASRGTNIYNLLRIRLPADATGGVINTLPNTEGTILNTGNYDKYALPLTGGTMTGAINFKSSNLDRNNPPSSETTSDVYCNFQDKDGNYIGRVVSAMNENGDIELILRARARNAADTGYILNDFKIIKSRNGTSSYSISSPTNFRTAIKALGFNDTKALLQATVGHSCKNLFEITEPTTTVTDVTFTVNKSAGTITASGTAGGQRNFYPQGSGRKPINDGLLQNGQILSCPNLIAGSRFYLAYYDSSSTLISEQGCDSSSSNTVISIPNNATYYRFYARRTSTTGSNTIIYNPMLRDGSISDDTFEPYQTPTDEAKQDKPIELVDNPPVNSISLPFYLNDKYSMLIITGQYTDSNVDYTIPICIATNMLTYSSATSFKIPLSPLLLPSSVYFLITLGQNQTSIQINGTTSTSSDFKIISVLAFPK